MSILLDRYRLQIEQHLGRALDPSDLAVAASVAEVTDAQVELGRALTARAQLLGLHYLRAVVPELDFRTASDAFDHVFLRRLSPQSWTPRF